MAWMPLPTASQCAIVVSVNALQKEGASMFEVTLIGIDLAKRVFQLHGARSEGSVAFRKKMSRGQLLAFVAQQPK
jgi:hypothetical protein